MNNDIIQTRIDILEKAIRIDPDNTALSHEMNELIKGRRAQVGEIRTWNGQKMQKQSDGTWKPVSEGSGETEDRGVGELKDTNLLVYKEGEYYSIPVSEDELNELRKRFFVTKQGRVGDDKSGFKVSEDGSRITGRGKIFVEVFKTLNKFRKSDTSKDTDFRAGINPGSLVFEIGGKKIVSYT